MEHETIEHHVRAAARPGAETDRLLRTLMAPNWPGGPVDRSDAALRGWLRHFQAIAPYTVMPPCACGRCAARN